MKKLSIAVIFYVACNCFAQKQNTTPVPILKQINRHNEDGSYSYGYEAADGSFKIESKSASGEVKGKYGYIDADGNLREISYGADKHGFNPEGTDINVPPRTIHSENDNRYPSLKPGEIDDGQYREDPNIYLNSKYNAIPAVKKAKSFSPPQNFNYQTTETPVYEEPQTQAPQFYQSRFQAPVQQQSYFKKPQQQQQNYYQQPNHQQPNYYQPKNNYQQQQQTPNIFAGHPAQNFDVFSGSYTVQY